LSQKIRKSFYKAQNHQETLQNGAFSCLTGYSLFNALRKRPGKLLVEPHWLSLISGESVRSGQLKTAKPGWQRILAYCLQTCPHLNMAYIIILGSSTLMDQCTAYLREVRPKNC
jgi:hypothetical protein